MTDTAHTEPVDGHCSATGQWCFPLGCSGPIGCNCECHAVPSSDPSQHLQHKQGGVS